MLLILKIIIIVCVVLILLYLWFTAPKIGTRNSDDGFKGTLYAHRGLHDNATDHPENSLAAFKLAVDAGFGIELDVQVSKDGIPVVFHDEKLERMTGKPGVIADYTLDELQHFKLGSSDETIPRFSDVLALVNGQVPLIVELKTEAAKLGVAPKAAELLDQYTGLYCMESFNPLLVLWFKKNRPTVVRGQLAEAFMKDESSAYHTPLYWLLQNLLFNGITKPDFVAYNHLHESVLARRLCHGLFNNKAAAWTIKSQEQLEAAEGHFDVFIFDSFVPEQK